MCAENYLGEMQFGFEVRTNGGDVKTYFDTDTNNSVPYNNDRYCVQEVLTFSDGSTCEEGELEGCEFVAQVGAPDPKDDVLQRSINSGIVVSASSSNYLCALISFVFL